MTVSQFNELMYFIFREGYNSESMGSRGEQPYEIKSDNDDVPDLFLDLDDNWIQVCDSEKGRIDLSKPQVFEMIDSYLNKSISDYLSDQGVTERLFDFYDMDTDQHEPLLIFEDI